MSVDIQNRKTSSAEAQAEALAQQLSLQLALFKIELEELDLPITNEVVRTDWKLDPQKYGFLTEFLEAGALRIQELKVYEVQQTRAAHEAQKLGDQILLMVEKSHVSRAQLVQGAAQFQELRQEEGDHLSITAHEVHRVHQENAQMADCLRQIYEEDLDHQSRLQQMVEHTEGLKRQSQFVDQELESLETRYQGVLTHLGDLVQQIESQTGKLTENVQKIQELEAAFQNRQKDQAGNVRLVQDFKRADLKLGALKKEHQGVKLQHKEATAQCRSLEASSNLLKHRGQLRQKIRVLQEKPAAGPPLVQLTETIDRLGKETSKLWGDIQHWQRLTQEFVDQRPAEIFREQEAHQDMVDLLEAELRGLQRERKRHQDTCFQKQAELKTQRLRVPAKRFPSVIEDISPKLGHLREESRHVRQELQALEDGQLRRKNGEPVTYSESTRVCREVQTVQEETQGLQRQWTAEKQAIMSQCEDAEQKIQRIEAHTKKAETELRLKGVLES